MGYERNSGLRDSYYRDRDRREADQRYRGRDDYRADYRDRDPGRPPSGYDYDDRGFLDRAGDEVRSWFGDEEAERRRRWDERVQQREYERTYGRDGGRFADSGYGASYGMDPVYYGSWDMFGGATYGTAGQYETIAGRVYGEIDPTDPHNTIINDIELAPKNAYGKILKRELREPHWAGRSRRI